MRVRVEEEGGAYTSPWLAQHPPTSQLLRMTITVEMGVIACVLIVTAVLTTYFAPEMAATPEAAS